MIVHRLLDAGNKLFNHIVVGLFSVAIFYILFFLVNISYVRASAFVAFFLLFLTLIIGPIMQLARPSIKVLPWGLPWSWRGEFGIWFVVWSIIHVLFIFQGANWDIAGYLKNIRAGDFAALVALFWGVILAATSFSGVIKFLGVESWRWLHSFTYVVFYLVGVHVINHAFLRSDRPSDWLHWSYLVMMIIVILLQFTAFFKVVVTYRKGSKE